MVVLQSGNVPCLSQLCLQQYGAIAGTIYNLLTFKNIHIRDINSSGEVEAGAETNSIDGSIREIRCGSDTGPVIQLNK